MNTPAFTLRDATPADAPALAALLGSMGWFAAFQQGSTQEHAAQLAPLLAPSEHHWLRVACTPDGQLLGYCAVHWLPIAILQSWAGYVSELFIAEQARGLGLGSQMLEQATQRAREKGCKRIWLINNRERDSYQRGFYAQQGWQEQAQAARFVLAL